MRTFKGKKNKKIEEVKAAVNALDSSVDAEAEKTVIEPTKEKIENPTTSSKTKRAKVSKSLCKIIVATPRYFVIDKNGEKITINKKNAYRRGEEIYY